MVKSLGILVCLLALGFTVAQNETIMATTTAPKTAKSVGLTVTCNSEYMEVGLDTNVHTEIQADTLTLEDKNCKLSRSEGGILYFKTALDGCGTKHNTTKDEVIYYNSLYAETTAGSNSAKISRAFQAEFPFKCTFPRSAVLSVVNFSPRKKVLYSTASEYGNFTFKMDLYKSDEYKEEYTNYPIEVKLNAWIYIQTSVSSNDSKLALFNERCWATPSSDANHKDQHVLLDKGCQKEAAKDMEYKYQKNEEVQQFKVRAFRFMTGSGNTVYLHCRVEVCREGDKDSSCAKGCEGVDRKRRSLASDASSEVLTVGVINIADGPQPAAATGNASSLTTISVIAGVLGVLVVGLVVVLVVVYRKRQPAHTAASSKVAGADGDKLMA